jgi:hypothetical protein
MAKITRDTVRALSIAVVLVGVSSCGAVAQTQTPAAVSSQPASTAIPTFASETEWRKHIEAEIPLVKTWADDQVVPIGQAFCHDWDKLPRLTTYDIDHSMDVLMNGGPGKMNREEAWIFLTNSVAQFCPTYNTALSEYR